MSIFFIVPIVCPFFKNVTTYYNQHLLFNLDMVDGYAEFVCGKPTVSCSQF